MFFAIVSEVKGLFEWSAQKVEILQKKRHMQPILGDYEGFVVVVREACTLIEVSESTICDW